jgi:hypothetical protein
MEKTSPQEEEFLESHGWYSHFIIPEDNEQKWVNFHTHGLPELYGQLDFQFVLPIDHNTLHALTAKLVTRVIKGERFTAGMRVTGIVRKYDVLLVKTTETRSIKRQVLRVILPDKDGNLDKATTSGIFAAQFQELPD